jgi:methionyl-tRNA formyltransferase
MLAYNNMLASVVIQDLNNELKAILTPFCNETKTDLHIFSKKDFKPQLALWLDKYKPDAVWIMTSPFIIPSSLLNKPRFGFINFHYGLLPQYRGANPVFEQIRRREKQGGITVHQVDESIDTGPVILQQRVPIVPHDTYAMHMNKLAMPCMEVAKLVLQMMVNGGDIPSFPQNEDQAVYYNRPTQDDVAINWETMSAADIVALANACNPWNKGAVTAVQSLMVGVTSARVADTISPDDIKPGTILSVDNQNGLTIACVDGKVLLVDVLYTSDGFLPGQGLKIYNIQKGMSFNTINKKTLEISN